MVKKLVEFPEMTQEDIFQFMEDTVSEQAEDDLEWAEDMREEFEERAREEGS